MGCTRRHRSTREVLRDGLPGVPVMRLLAAGVSIVLVSAWCNRGFLSLDEHFQINEFAWYKLGHTPASALAWEFPARMRAGIQPFIAAGVFRALEVAGVFNPFAATFLLRLLSGLPAFWVSLTLAARVLPELQRPALRLTLLAGTLFFWILPEVHGRFSSENWGGMLFFGGLCALWPGGTLAARGPAVRDLGVPGSPGPPGLPGSVPGAVLAGLLFGAAFYCRFQIGFALAGIASWLLLVRRPGIRIVVALAAAFVLMCAANTAVDDWLYGAWTCSPCNYLRMNVLEGRAASFGTAPWWFYLGQLLMYLVPPYSLVVLPMLIWGAWRCRRHPLVWVVVPFFIGHTVVAHKETRFLIPISYALVPLVVVSLDNLPSRTSQALARLYHTVAGRWAARIFLGANLVAVAVMAVKPADEREVVFRYLYDEAKKRPITLYTATTSPYVQVTDPLSFYRPDTLTVEALGTMDDLRAAVAAEPGGVFFFQRCFTPPSWQASSGLRLTPVVRTLPGFVNRVNLNDWVSRMNRWTVFEVEGR